MDTIKTTKSCQHRLKGKLTSRSSAHEGRHSALVGYAGYKVTGKHSHRTSFIKSHAKIVGSFLYKMPVYVFCTKPQDSSVAHTPQLCYTCSYSTTLLCMQHTNEGCTSTCSFKGLSAHSRFGGNGLGNHAFHIHTSFSTASLIAYKATCMCFAKAFMHA
jgi:hypothetical protein